MNDWLEYSEYCPYCGEKITLLVDCSQPEQTYVEDCEVCCRPIQVTISFSGIKDVDIVLKHENEV